MAALLPSRPLARLIADAALILHRRAISRSLAQSAKLVGHCRRRTMGKIGQFCPKIVELLTGTTAGNGTWWNLKVV